MAFPSIAGSAALTQLTSANPGTVAMPSGIVAGELLLAVCAGDTSGTMTQSGGSDWTRIDHGANGTAVQGAIFAKIAAGGDTLSVQFEANDFAAVSFRVQDHGVSDVAADITLGAAATGASGTPNPPNCNPGVAADYLWIECFAADDDDNSASYPSANYTGIGQAESAQSSSSCMAAAAYSQLNAASEDPGTMTMAASEEWRAQTLAIPPAAAGDVSGSQASTEANDTTSASGTVTVEGSSAITEAADTASASGTVEVTGTSAITEANDTAAASGEVTDAGVTGSQASTEGNDSASASGLVSVIGTASVTEDADSASASGLVEVVGTSAATEANDTASASGLVLQDVEGSSAIVEENDTASASGYVGAEEQPPSVANDGAWVKLTGEYPTPHKRREEPLIPFPPEIPAPALREVRVALETEHPALSVQHPELEVEFRETLAGRLAAPVPRDTPSDEDVAIALLLAG